MWRPLKFHLFVFSSYLQSFDSYSSIVWSTNPSHAERLLSLSSAEFCEEVNYALQAPPHSVTSQYAAAYVG
jgi:hypothetical protein